MLKCLLQALNVSISTDLVSSLSGLCRVLLQGEKKGDKQKI